MRDISKQPTWALLLFVIISVALRFFSFFPSVLDHDESTYLEIAREMLLGKVLYVDLIDIKPPGIFLIYAFFQLVFGHSIWMMRLLAALWIALTAFMIFKTSRLFIPSNRVAIAGGLIYILFVSTWSGYGISPNIEIYFNLFTVSGLYVLVKRDHWLNFFGAGLILGAGFIIKYLVLFDFAAFMLFFLWKAIKQSSWPNISHLLINGCMAVAGFVLPFLMINLYYHWTGHFAAFAEIAYFTIARYPKEFVPVRMIKFVMDFCVFFLPVHFFFVYTLFSKSMRIQTGKDLPLLSVFWIILVLIGILLPGNTFKHYFIQLMLPISIASGTFFHPDSRLPLILARLTRGIIGLIILVSLFITIILFSKRDHFGGSDTPAVIAEYLRPRLKPGDVIYAANHFHILYYLLEKECPTPYVHPTLLITPSHREALNLDLDKELQRIIGKKPAYILIQMKGKNKVDWLFPFLNENYVFEKQFAGKMSLYRHKDKTPIPIP